VHVGRLADDHRAPTPEEKRGMKEVKLPQRIETAQEHLRALIERADGLAPDLRSQIADALEELHTSLEKLQGTEEALDRQTGLFENVLEAVISTDLEFRIKTWNRAAEALYGFKAEEVIGKRMGDVIRTEYPYDGRDDALKRLSEDDHWRGEVVQRLKDGQEINVVCSVSYLVDGRANPVGMIAINRNITDRKRAEEALRESEKRLAHIVDAIPVPLVITRESDGRILHTNRQYGKALGVPAEDLLGATSIGYYADTNGRETMLEKLSRDGKVEGYQLHATRGDGAPLWAMVSAQPLPFMDEPAILIVFQDITERMQVQEEHERLLVQSEELRQDLESERDALRAIMENTEAQLAYLDRGFNFLTVNSAYAHGAGYSKDELAGQNHFELFPDPENEAIFEQVRDTGQPVAFVAKPFVYPERPELGTTYWDWTLMPVKDSEGEVQGLVLSLMDVTERIRTEEELRKHRDHLEELVERRTVALRASEARFRSIFEGTSVGIAVADMEGLLTDANPSLRRMLGCSIEEIVGKHFSEFIYPDDLETDVDSLHELLPEANEHQTTELRYVPKNGEPRWANISLSLVERHKDHSPFAVGVIEDITGRKQAEVALIAAERLAITGRLAASLAHEVNNPLQTVIGCLGLADEALAQGEDASRYVEIGLEELRRAARVVARLRDLSRESEPGEKSPTDLGQLIEDVLTLTRKQCEEQQVEVVSAIQEELPPVLLARDRMKQVFLNLMLNAIQAMPEGGQLGVRTTITVDPAGVSVSFVDSGLGIAPDVMSHLFTPFYTTKSEGLGLGLFISQNIVDQEGGSIDADSCPGEGTTFTVWLPV
jgi:PAS domain S-box-containing protein